MGHEGLPVVSKLLVTKEFLAVSFFREHPDLLMPIESAFGHPTCPLEGYIPYTDPNELDRNRLLALTGLCSDRKEGVATACAHLNRL